LAHSDALTGRPNLRSVFSAAAVISPTPNGPDCGVFRTFVWLRSGD
jgi:hypothetical protein